MANSFAKNTIYSAVFLNVLCKTTKQIVTYLILLLYKSVSFWIVKFTFLKLQHYNGKHGQSDRICSDGLSNLVVRWNGKVTYCCGDINTSTVLGTIPETRITDIWKSRLLARIHESIKNKERLYACRDCNVTYDGVPHLKMTKETYEMLSDDMKTALAEK